jgi:hypothetical protein
VLCLFCTSCSIRIFVSNIEMLVIAFDAMREWGKYQVMLSSIGPEDCLVAGQGPLVGRGAVCACRNACYSIRQS